MHLAHTLQYNILHMSNNFSKVFTVYKLSNGWSFYPRSNCMLFSVLKYHPRLIELPFLSALLASLSGRACAKRRRGRERNAAQSKVSATCPDLAFQLQKEHFYNLLRLSPHQHVYFVCLSLERKLVPCVTSLYWCLTFLLLDSSTSTSLGFFSSKGCPWYFYLIIVLYPRHNIIIIVNIIYKS